MLVVELFIDKDDRSWLRFCDYVVLIEDLGSLNIVALPEFPICISSLVKHIVEYFWECYCQCFGIVATSECFKEVMNHSGITAYLLCRCASPSHHQVCHGLRRHVRCTTSTTAWYTSSFILPFLHVKILLFFFWLICLIWIRYNHRLRLLNHFKFCFSLLYILFIKADAHHCWVKSLTTARK